MGSAHKAVNRKSSVPAASGDFLFLQRNSGRNRMKKHIVPIFFLCIIPLSALALTLYCLETYYEVVHSEASILVCGYSVLAFAVSTLIWYRMKTVSRCSTVIWIVSTIVLVFVFYVGSKIPFCVVCDHVTAEDLGFLIHWIQPEVPPQ